MDISSDKLAKSHTGRSGHGYKKKTFKSLLIAAQNNPIRTNHIKTKIDNTLQIRYRMANVGYVVIETKQFT